MSLSEQPVVVTDNGEILVRRGDDETEDPKAHRELVHKVRKTFGSDEEDENGEAFPQISDSHSEL